MLDTIIQYSENILNTRVVSLKAKIDSFNLKYGIMTKMIMALLKMNKLEEDDREKLFYELISNYKEKEYLYLFNDLFKTNFSKSRKHFKLTLKEIKKLMRMIGYLLVDCVGSFLDD